MQQRFVVLDDWTDFWGSQPALERLRQRGEVTIHTTPAANEDDVMRRLENATVVLANRERTQLNASVLRSAERLELQYRRAHGARWQGAGNADHRLGADAYARARA